MNYLKALGYVGSITEVAGSITAYGQHKDESVLAEELSDIILGMARQAFGREALKGVDQERLVKAVGELVDVFEGTLY